MDLEQTKTYLDTLSLSTALWWFIENVPADDPNRTALFFHLREKQRNNEDEQLLGDIANFLVELSQCYSRSGEFNNYTAPLGTTEIREKAIELATKLGVPPSEDDETEGEDDPE